MGLPTSAILAEIAMHFIEDKLWKKRVVKSNISYTCRYVDDTFIIVNKHKVKDVLVIFNSVHNAIQFTMESEMNCKIPFLDVLVMRNDNHLENAVYAGITLNFLTAAPLRYKFNSLRWAINRAVNVCTEGILLIQELDNIRNIFKANNYPLTFINNTINKILRGYRRRKIVNVNKQNSKYVSLPFDNDINNWLAPLLGKFDIKLAYKANNTINRLINFNKETY